MKINLIMALLTILSCLGCTMLQGGELVSLSFDYSVNTSDYRLRVSIVKVDEKINATYQENSMQTPLPFAISEEEFKKLNDSAIQLEKSANKKKKATQAESSREGTLTAVFKQKSKEITKSYSVGQLPETEKIIELIKNCVDQTKAKSEIRIGFHRAIPYVTNVCTVAKPADLVEYLGVFVVRRNHKEGTPGGGEDLSLRWKAIKPGKVTIWFEQLADCDASSLPDNFAPYGCYIIDEQLNVHHSKELTDKAKEKFNQTKQ